MSDEISKECAMKIGNCHLRIRVSKKTLEVVLRKQVCEHGGGERFSRSSVERDNVILSNL